MFSSMAGRKKEHHDDESQALFSATDENKHGEIWRLVHEMGCDPNSTRAQDGGFAVLKQKELFHISCSCSLLVNSPCTPVMQRVVGVDPSLGENFAADPTKQRNNPS